MFYSGIVSQCNEILMAEKQIILKVLNDALLEGGEGVCMNFTLCHAAILKGYHLPLEFQY